MKVAVITPFHNETPEQILKCHSSTVEQTHKCQHILVCDNGRSLPFIPKSAQVITMPVCHNDYGGTARAIGAMSALAQGYDAIAFLDADNWYSGNHIEKMVELQAKEKADVCIAKRRFHRPDFTIIDIPEESNHADTNCLFLTAKAARFSPLWSIKPNLMKEIEDRIFYLALQNSGMKIAHYNGEKTVSYVTRWKAHYDFLGEQPPEGAKENTGSGFAEWQKNTPLAEKNEWSLFLFGVQGLL